MTDLITVTGIVGSDPRAIVTAQQLPITSFRLASSRRYFNRATGEWEDAGTNWYTVSAFRNLAFNANASLRKGEHVVVHGRLKQRPWQAGDKAGVAIEIEADSIGHDLAWGITQLQRLEQQQKRDAVGDHLGADGADGAADDDAEGRLDRGEIGADDFADDADGAGGFGGDDDDDEAEAAEAPGLPALVGLAG